MSGVKRGPCLSELFRVGLETFRTLRTSGLFCVGRMSPHAPDVGAILCRSDVPIRSGRRGFFMPVCEACPRASVRAGRCPDVGQGGLRRIHSILSVLRLRSPSPFSVSGSRLRFPSPFSVSGSRLRFPSPFSVSGSRLRFPSPVPVSGSRLRSPSPFSVSVSVSVSRLRFLPACPAGRNHPSGRFSKRKLPAVVGWVKCRNRAIIG